MSNLKVFNNSSRRKFLKILGVSMLGTLGYSLYSSINKNNLKDFFNYLNIELPQLFHLEIINFVCTKKELSSKYNLIFLEEKEIKKNYSLNNHFIMDAVDNGTILYKNTKKKNIFKCNFLFKF